MREIGRSAHPKKGFTPWLGVGLATAALLLPATGLHAAPASSPSTIRLEVDASEATRKILHARLMIPCSPGSLTLLYPKWIPGEHGPTGPIADLAGLRFTSAGRTIPWSRDLVDMYALRVDIPKGSTTLEADLDYLSPSEREGFSGSASATAQLAVLSWNQLLLYPKGQNPDALRYAASLRLPPGWKCATALPIAKEEPGKVEFQEVTLTTLVDSPVLTGAWLRDFDLSSNGGVREILHAASDNPSALAMPDDLHTAFSRLVAEENALFGARHYREYHFLVTLSDLTAHFGLEHHESSDDRTWERAFIDEDRRRLMAGLLSHEMVHSWNGKYRRPADLTTNDFSEPMRTDLLWVYEGLTQYLGDILSARSGLRTPEEYRDEIAADAARLEQRAGRGWRPLSDTAVAAQLLYEARDDWANWRRGTDFYAEGGLIWLEADTIIRQKSGGRLSLDDFCRRFHGSPGGPPEVKTYTFDDVVAALDRTVAYDWKGFLEERLDSTDPRPPMGGLQASGWKLVYTNVITPVQKSREEVLKIIDDTSSIGLLLSRQELEEGRVIDVVPGLPAANAGIAPGMKLIAVNGRKLSKEGFREAIAAARSSSEPIELLVENSEFYRTYRVDYHLGERYPHLERDPSRPDLLSAIITPLTWKRAAAAVPPAALDRSRP